VVVARALGVEGFGAFSGTVALVALIGPFGSLGAINLMIRNITRDPQSAARQYSTAVVITAVSGAVFSLLLAGAAAWVAPSGVASWIVLCVAVGDLLGNRLVELAGAVHLAQDRMFRTAIFPLYLHGARLAAALGLFVVVPHADLGTWAVFYLAASLLVTVPILLVTLSHVGRGRLDLPRYRAEWREGVLFAFGFAAQTVYNDIDKAMLARLGTLEATGIYSAAYRVIDMAFVPMRALLSASYARFFREGNQGLTGTVAFAKRLAKPGLGYCLFASVALFTGADLLPVILGHEYEAAVGALRGLAVLPLLKGVHYLAGDSLTGAGLQGPRTAVQVGIAVLNVGLNFWLLPLYSWQGAVAASLICDMGLAVALWGIVIARRRTA
jgi:O-antigen/teichoic acid export membrane protein